VFLGPFRALAYDERAILMKLRLGTLALVMIVFSGCPPSRCEGPDPRATSIQYTLLGSTSTTSGTVRITGVVTNRGQSNFDSSAGQQSVYLYEGFELVAQQDFVDLAVDDTVEVSYDRNWNTADEFRPPTYQVMVLYDPDIYIDGNPNNDDCDQTNNDLERSTAALDGFFEL
jgi:hypothetical protein